MPEYIKRLVCLSSCCFLALVCLASSFIAAAPAYAIEKRPSPGYFSVIKVTPSPQNGQIRSDTVFRAEFDSALDASTVNERFVCLTLNGRPIKTELKYLKNSNAVIIKPSGGLSYDKIYSLVFKTGIRGNDGERLKSAVMYQYSTTVDPGRGAIRIISQFPLPGAEIYDPRPTIFVQFDRPLVFTHNENTEDLTDYISLFNNDDLVPSRVRYNRILKRLELFPAIELKSGVLYSAAVSRKARGANNKGLFETYVWQFRAYKPVFYLTSSYPSAADKFIGSYDRIMLTFSEPLDSRTDFEEFIRICDPQGGIINGRYMVYNVKNLLFMPDFAFYPGKYQIKISDQLKSFNANRINVGVTINFSVATDDYNVGEKIRDN
jgi:hypothetical protein